MLALQLPQLPASFYDQTPYLKHIQRAAHALRVAPDAVLVATLCRVAAATPPTTYIDTPEPCSLNFIGSLIAPSGLGKSRANTTATRIVPDLGLDVNDSLPLGTGEGLVESYFVNVSVVNDSGKGKHIEKRQAFKSGYFYCDEGETLLTLGVRKGSTILQTLRTAWSGGVIGNTNANIETRRKLDRYAYRASVLVAFQPSCGSALVADSNGGTPQRFLFASAVDREMPRIAATFPGVLAYDPTSEMLALKVHDEIARELDDNKYNSARGALIVDPLDTHIDYIRVRVAALFALLDCRRFIDLSHWNMATLVVDNSRQVRRTLDDWALLNRRDELTTQADERNYLDTLGENHKNERDLNRIANVLVRMVERHDGLITQPQALSRLGRDRHKVSDDDVMTALLATNRVEIVNNRLTLRHKA